MKRILITGSQGFIGSYLCTEFLNNSYEVIGVDDYSKYGKVIRAHDSHPNFTFCFGDIQQYKNFSALANFYKPQIIISLAAKIGGISYFHKYAYDLLASNERITSNVFDVAIDLYKKSILEKIVVVSSSMVFENTKKYPTPETSILDTPPPLTTYGFQKLATEYFAKGAFEQYGLPFQIVRPFNCVGIGEDKALQDCEVLSGNIKLMMSHVLPDLINKTLRGQNPLHILGDGTQIRCYTNGKDIARGIRAVTETTHINEDFNISTTEVTSVLELAKIVWDQINASPFMIETEPPFQYDVQKRIPDTTKSEKLLNFKAQIPLIESVKEVINYFKTMGKY